MRDIYIIAELGINHHGSKEVALELIKSAVESGVNGIKFQYRNLSNAYSKTVQEIGDEMLYSEIHDNYLEPAEILELTNQIKHLGIEAGISFFDVQDVQDFGERLLEFDFYKVPSAELNNYALHDALINTGKMVYLSTGCHHESEIENAFKRLPPDGWVPLQIIQ
jgi:N-acetylneuraminate synthase